MGCMGLSHGYGKIPEEKYSIEAIKKAYEFGCKKQQNVMVQI